MYFKVLKSSELGQKIKFFMDMLPANDEKFSAIAKELSDFDSPSYLTSSVYFTGLLAGIEFKNHPGKDWVEIKSPAFYGKRYFRPSSATAKKKKDIYLKYTSANNPIQNNDFNAVFGLKEGCVKSFKWYSCPGCIPVKDFFLVEISSEWASTIQSKSPDMVEILESEFLELSKE